MKTNPDFVLRNIYGKSILMPIRQNKTSNDPVLLEGVAPEIWNLASDGESYERIVDSLVQKYQLKKNSEEERAIEIFLDTLIEQGFILK